MRLSRAFVLATGLLAAAAFARAGSTPDSTRTPAADSAAAPTDTAHAGVARGWRLRELSAIEGDGAHPLVEPDGVLSDAFGHIWVSDASLHKLRRWRADGVPLDETGALGSEPTQFRRPGALARVGALGVAVLDVENRRVSTYDHNLRLLSIAVDLASTDLESRAGSVRPLSLASDRGGALYVVDAERDRILVFDYAGAFQREVGGYGGRSGSFSGLTGVAVTARGRIVTVERPRPRSKKADPSDSTLARARIQWLEAGGRLITSVWSPPLASGPSELSVAVAVDAIGRVAIAGERSGEVFVLSPEGAPIARLTGLSSPRALAFADDGTLLVAETGAARVRRWTLEPERTD
ncbi:MAG TPA: NHL repeat-containing protein [Verrucomicrobiae bacterium]|nr:NHL repeat-containing protein [Verrucomicrobiae bacterium]